MSEHAWVLENLETYTAGGLDAEEAERLEQHTASCEACSRALEQARVLDRSMSQLFAGAVPGPGMEERLFRALRTASRPRRRGMRAVLAAAAAVLLVGIVGWQMTRLLDGNSAVVAIINGSGSMFDANAYTRVAEVIDGMKNTVPSSSLDKDSGSVVYLGELRESPVGSANEMAQQLRRRVLEEEQTSPAELLKSLGHYPPARALLAPGKNAALSADPLADTSGKLLFGEMAGAYKDWFNPSSIDAGVSRGTSRIHTNLGGGIVSKPDASYRNDTPAPSQSGGLVPPGVTVNNTINPPGGTSLGIGSAANSPAKTPATMPPPALNSQAEEARQRYYTQLRLQNGVSRNATSEEDVRAAKLAWDKAMSEGKNAKKDRDDQNVGDKSKGIEPELLKRPADALQAQQPVVNPWLNLANGGNAALNYFNGVLPQRQLNNESNILQAGPGSQPPPAPRKIVIRSGTIEFEIQSFDSAVAAVTRLANNIKGGFVDTVNSEKLPNGKVHGSIVVRVPPEHLDALILDLRKELGLMGELKNLRVGSQDITKQYTDLESRLRAARTMEERLLQIIKTGKGEIKDLLLAEKELGVWRTKIEEIEGELRYYSNLVSLSTLTITLAEKEIRSPFAIVETERVQMGVEVEEVDKALQQAVAAVTEAKGRVTKSELKQLAAGQFTAILNFEVAPQSAGPLRDRLRQLGNVARLEIDRLQEAEGGTGKPQDARSKRNDTQFFVSLYNLANVAPRETVQVNLACGDVEASLRTILARVEKAAGRVVSSNMNRQRNEQTSATIQFEVKSAEADAVARDLKEAGEVLRLQSTETPDAANVTRSKRGFVIQLLGFGLVAPRQSANLTVATRDVPAGYQVLQDAIAKAKARVLNAQLNEQDKQNITADLEFEIRRPEEAAIDAALEKVGETFSRTVTRAADADNVLDSLLRMHVSLVNLARIPPRETLVLGIEVPNVDNSAANFTALVHESQGRTVESHIAHERSGRVTAKLIFDVPLANGAALADKFKGAGTVRVQQSSRNTQVPEGPLAIARFDVTLSNADLIVPSDDGLWPQIRKGLSTSFSALSWSLTVLIVGLSIVLPWGIILYGVYRIIQRMRRQTGSETTTA